MEWNEITERERRRIQSIKRIFNVTEEVVIMKDLSGYAPEAPSETSNDPFSYKGPINVLFSEKCKGAEIKLAEQASEGEGYATKVGDRLLSIGLQVPEDASENARRVFFKKWNIDSTAGNAGKDGVVKTPQHKLMGWLKNAELKADTEDNLMATISALNTGKYDIHTWIIEIGGKKIQMSKLEKSGKYAGQSSSTPASVAF